ncbi:MAG: hypothetical protein JKX84_00860 [Flavobacteriales bacterium]|nr:hypothetical protein [Flavobacteriales bacterium]
MSKHKLRFMVLFNCFLIGLGSIISAQGQNRLVAPQLTSVEFSALDFALPTDIGKLKMTSRAFQKYSTEQKVSLDWNTSRPSGLNENSHALLNDALPSWMDAQMWNSMPSSVNRMFGSGPNVLDAAPAERNFEIHLDAQEQYGSEDY